MSVQQTRSIIDHVRVFHQWVSQYYHRLAESTQRKRTKLLLDYMSEHEQRLANCLKEYEESAPHKIMDTWLMSTDAADATQLIADSESVSDMSVDDVIALGIRLSQCAISVYEDLADYSEPESVRETFANLLHLEEKALKQFVRDAGRLEDL